MTAESGSDGTDTGFTLIESTFPDIPNVRLYEDTWTEIQTKHPEFRSEPARAALENTIAKPTQVHRSRTHPNDSFVYVSEENTYMGNACAVAVRRFQDTTSGNVRTAIFTDHPSGTPYWRSSDDGE